MSLESEFLLKIPPALPPKKFHHPSLAEALDEAIALLEAAIPANPNSAGNARHEREYARIVARYFQKLEKALPYARLASVYRESRRIREAESDDLIDPVLRAFAAEFLAEVTAQHVAVYLAGAAEVTSWGKTLRGLPIIDEGPPMGQAVGYAREHCATLVTRMDDESRRLIAQTVSDAIKNKRGVDGLAQDIRARFQDMSTVRSKVIARTETCDALQQAFVDRSEAIGVTGKEWVVTVPCEICAVNEGVVRPVGGWFPSGHARPPAHPNCRCALAPVML